MRRLAILTLLCGFSALGTGALKAEDGDLDARIGAPHYDTVAPEALANVKGRQPDAAMDAVAAAGPAEAKAPPSAADAASGKAKAAEAAPPSAEEICRLIAASADRVGMNRDFFARLIWKESRFDVKAISPVGARGIAQFMPYTAKERGLANPYDYEEAIKHSALYLRDLKAELGNWGLAAAAYNGGINRMKGWIARGATGALPYETVEYVNAITFRPVEWFAEEGREVEPRPLDKDRSFGESCARLPIMKTRAVFASLDGGGGEAVPMKPWGVQVAGHAKRSIAMKMFNRVRANYGGVLGGRQPLVLRARNAAHQSIYAVRIGADSRGEANSLCGRLRGAGGSCIVMKN